MKVILFSPGWRTCLELTLSFQLIADASTCTPIDLPVVVIGWSEVGMGGAAGIGEALTVALRPGRRRLSITHRGFYQRVQCVCLGYRPCVSPQCHDADTARHDRILRTWLITECTWINCVCRRKAALSQITCALKRAGVWISSLPVFALRLRCPCVTFLTLGGYETWPPTSFTGGAPRQSTELLKEIQIEEDLLKIIRGFWQEDQSSAEAGVQTRSTAGGRVEDKTFLPEWSPEIDWEEKKNPQKPTTNQLLSLVFTFWRTGFSV